MSSSSQQLPSAGRPSRAGAQRSAGHGRFVLAVHGGAADYRVATIGRRRASEGLDAVAASLSKGGAVLAGGGSALDAVVAAVSVLEDSGALNAGRGAARREDGSVQLDAAVIRGTDRRAGAVAAVTELCNPVQAARAVLDEGRHVLLVGKDAERFATERGLPASSWDWFRPGLERELADRDVDEADTVGAVALDQDGNVAAATSTGGLSGSRSGRVGDSPVIGAGTWADNATVAVSATGAGEAFMRAVFAHEVHARMSLTGADVHEACAAALTEVSRMGGDGGCVAVDVVGTVAMPFTAPAMFRGWTDDSGTLMVGLEAGECEAP